MSQVQRVTRRPAAGIHEERLASLVLVENAVKVAVGEEQAASQPAVRLVARQPLEALEELVVNQLRRPFSKSRTAQLAGVLAQKRKTHALGDRDVVEGEGVALLVAGGLNVPGIDFLLGSGVLLGRVVNRHNRISLWSVHDCENYILVGS